MTIKFPQEEGRPPSGGSDFWDTPAGALRLAEYLDDADPAPAYNITIPFTPPTRVSGGFNGATTTTVVASFATDTLAVGDYILAILHIGEGYGATEVTSVSFADNKSHSYTTEFVSSDNVGGAVGYVRVTSPSGVVTVTASIIGTGLDTAAELQLIPVRGLVSSSVRDILVNVSDALSYLTQFNISSPSPTDTPAEFVLVASFGRNFGTYNDVSDRPGWITFIEDLGIRGVGTIHYKITSATGTQSIDLTGYPQDGAPGAIMISFRGAAIAAAGQVKYWNGSAWVTKPVKHWNGSAWVTKPLKRYNGSAWV